jgi:putative addiction module killer protein
MAQREYVDDAGRKPFSRWTAGLNDVAASKVSRALERLASGNVSNVKAVGQGVNEIKIDFGPGYRVYFGWDGRELVILLGGGTKKRQGQDIAHAQARWADYRRRKGAIP